jgi:hypothetical protein
MGVIKNVVPGAYTRSVKNKSYVVRALDILRSNPLLASDEMGLWQIVTQGTAISPNSQMDVVTTLWREGIIEYP